MLQIKMVSLLIVFCVLLQGTYASETSSSPHTPSCGAYAAYHYLLATGRSYDLQQLLNKDEFSKSSQSIEEVRNGLERYGVFVTPVKVSSSQLSQLNGYTILYLIKDKQPIGHFVLCRVRDQRVQVFEHEKPSFSYNPSDWDKAGVTTIVFLESANRSWFVISAYLVVIILGCCFIANATRVWWCRTKVVYLIAGMSVLIYGCNKETQVSSVGVDGKSVLAAVSSQEPGSATSGFVNANRVVLPVGEIVISYVDTQAKAEVTLKNISGITLSQSNFETPTSCCSPAKFTNIEPNEVPDQKLFKAYFDIRSVLPGKNRIPLTVNIKTDQFMSQWGDDVEVEGSISQAYLTSPIILVAKKSVRGDERSVVSGEAIVTLPTESFFDKDLLRIDMPKLEMSKLNSDSIVTRKDQHYTAYVIPISGELSLDDSLIGAGVLSGTMHYGDARAEVRLKLNHFPEWTLTGGRTKASCIILNNKAFPAAVTIENMHNKSFAIQRASLGDGTLLDTLVEESTVKFVPKKLEGLLAQDVKTELIVDIKSDNDAEPTTLRFPLEIHHREIQSANAE